MLEIITVGEGRISETGDEVSGFLVPEKALYISDPKWLSHKTNIITESHRYVMGSSYAISNYRPIPGDVFDDSLKELMKMGAIEIRPSDLRESIDRDSLKDSIQNKTLKYLLTNGVLIRLRNDAEGQDLANTLIMLGLKDDLVDLATKIGLPHPFDKREYPYRNIFETEQGVKKIHVLD